MAKQKEKFLSLPYLHKANQEVLPKAFRCFAKIDVMSFGNAAGNKYQIGDTNVLIADKARAALHQLVMFPFAV